MCTWLYVRMVITFPTQDPRHNDDIGYIQRPTTSVPFINNDLDGQNFMIFSNVGCGFIGTFIKVSFQYSGLG